MSKHYINYYRGQWDNVKWYNEFGKLHNSNDMPAVIWSNGGELYYKYGIYHRDDGPAYMMIISSGTSLYWFYNGVPYTPKCVKL